MLTTKSSLFAATRTILLTLFLGLGFAGNSFAVKDDPTPGEMLTMAMERVQKQQYDEALDLMYQYLDAVEDSTASRVMVIAQDVRFRMATILIDRGRKDEAAEILSIYVSLPLGKHMRQAYKMLVACYFDTEMYAECIPAVTNALYYNDNPILVAYAVKSVDDPTAGDDEVAEDLPYTQEELTILYFTLAESHFKLKQFEECIDPFSYVIEHAKDAQRKGYSMMQVINSLIELNHFDRIISWVPQLYRTPARYDIRVNLALLKAAAALYAAGEYDSALPLYRMIVPKEELIEYQEKRIREMRIEAGLPPELGAEMTPEEQLLFGVKDDARTAMDEAKVGDAVEAAVMTDEEREMQKPRELRELEQLLEALKQMEPYENHVNFQMAQLYKNVERYWEAVTFFDKVHYATPDSDMGGRSIYESILALTDKLGEADNAKERAFKYLDLYKAGTYPRYVAYVLISYFQKQKDWKSIQALCPYIDGFDPDPDPDVIRFDTELKFMEGVASLMLQSYSNAVERFQMVINDYPGTDQAGRSLFWCGFSYLCLDDHEKAYNCFETYPREFPNGDLLDEAYFQGGISLFGLDRLEEAKERFSYVIDEFGPSSSVYPDSCSRRGDILGAEGGDALDAAVADYRNAFNASTKVSQATYATFQMCEIFKADEANYGPDHVIKAVNLYLAKWGDQGADLAKALFWLGRTKIQQKRYEEAADSYIEAIIDYGGDLRQDGVDLMIPELVKISTVFLKEDQREDIKTRLRLAMESTDNETLRLRLRVVLAQFDKSVVELGEQLIKELPDLDHASPPVLAAICEASFALKDYSRSEELLRTFKYKFEDSDYMRSAYKLRASGQLAKKDYDGALLTIADAQAEYGTERDAAWAQLMKAQVQLIQGKVDEARETNKDVFGVPDWRGEAEAQAIYQLGQVEEAAGDPRLAHGYYQRAYFQYKGFANGHWAAEAYLGSARCLKKLMDDPGTDADERVRLEKGVRDTYRAMLYDKYVNTLPEAEVARKELGQSDIAQIQADIDAGVVTNIAIDVEVKMGASEDESKDGSSDEGAVQENAESAGGNS